MKKILFSTILFIIILTGNIYSQQEFKVGVSSGITTSLDVVNGAPNKLGLASLINFSYSPIADVDLYLSCGMLIFGYNNSFIHNVKLTPIIVGIKYRFAEGDFRPYLAAEIQKVFGERNYGYNDNSGLFPSGVIGYRSSTITNINEYMFAAGLGTVHQLSKSLELDLQLILVFTSRSTSAQNVRLLIGVNYLL